MSELHDTLYKDAWQRGYNDMDGDGYNNPYTPGSDQWQAYQDGWEENQRQYKERWEGMRELDETVQLIDPMMFHKCEKIAAVRHIGPGREWWIGKLLEPLPGHPLETHCMHITTPYKSVVWGMTVGDFEAYAVLCQVVHEQPLNPNWLMRMAESYKKEAKKDAAQ